VLVQDRCMVCTKRTMGSEIILDTPNGTLDDEAQVKARFCLFGDSVNLDARWAHYVRRTYHRFRNHFGRTRLNLYVTWVMWIIVLVCLDMELALMQDRCTVCVKLIMR
jgi:hypothetical protein